MTCHPGLGLGLASGAGKFTGSQRLGAATPLPPLRGTSAREEKDRFRARNPASATAASARLHTPAEGVAMRSGVCKLMLASLGQA
mmetsp:Transcript_16959/g.59313  ORF Transcript_16959/g.59313 Transcript_16959/m.59313 type:complete len:85 (-) Transcript_16959:3-257(-)